MEEETRRSDLEQQVEVEQVGKGMVKPSMRKGREMDFFTFLSSLRA